MLILKLALSLAFLQVTIASTATIERQGRTLVLEKSKNTAAGLYQFSSNTFYKLSWVNLSQQRNQDAIQPLYRLRHWDKGDPFLAVDIKDMGTYFIDHQDSILSRTIPVGSKNLRIDKNDCIYYHSHRTSKRVYLLIDHEKGAIEPIDASMVTELRVHGTPQRLYWGDLYHLNSEVLVITENQRLQSLQSGKFLYLSFYHGSIDVHVEFVPDLATATRFFLDTKNEHWTIIAQDSDIDELLIIDDVTGQYYRGGPILKLAFPCPVICQRSDSIGREQKRTTAAQFSQRTPGDPLTIEDPDCERHALLHYRKIHEQGIYYFWGPQFVSGRLLIFDWNGYWRYIHDMIIRAKKMSTIMSYICPTMVLFRSVSAKYKSLLFAIDLAIFAVLTSIQPLMFKELVLEGTIFITLCTFAFIALNYWVAG